MTTIDALLDRVEKTRRKGPLNVQRTNHILNTLFPSKPTLIFHEETTSEIECLNAMISDRSYHLGEFVELWNLFSSYREDDRKNQYLIFGKNFIETSRGNIMGTLTADGTQFRVWNGIPANIRANHIDSCGQNLVFGAYGAAKYVKQLPPIIFPLEKQYSPLTLPNGVTLFMQYYP